MRISVWVRWFLFLGVVGLAVFASGCGNDSQDDDDDAAVADDDTVEDNPSTALAVSLADTWMRYYEPSQNAWSWDAGILMMGMIALTELTSDGQYSDYARAWLDGYIESGFTVSSSDTCVPGYAALLFFEQTGNRKYIDAANRVWTYIRDEAGRTRDGGLNHMGWISGNQIWADTLFMVGPFLLKFAEVTGDDAPYEEFALQLRVFRKHLRDPGEGLYRHRYDDDTGEVLPATPLYWGRGNGWVFVASMLAYNKLPQYFLDHLGYRLSGDIGKMSDGFETYQDESGRFHTLINRPDTYLETSAGLLYAYGLTIGMQDRRLIGKDRLDQVERWMQGAIDQIVTDEAGDALLLGTSYGTSPGGVEYYQQVLKGENVAYGLGIYFLLALEYEKAGRASGLQDPSGETDETYAHPPVPCVGSACGKFQLSRGNFNRAKEAFADALADDPADAKATFYDTLIDLIRLALAALDRVNALYIGDTRPSDLLAWLTADAQPELARIADAYTPVEQNADFTDTLDRLVIIESGGHNAVGSREYDLGEAYVLDGAARLLSGLIKLVGNEPAALPAPYESAREWIARVEEIVRPRFAEVKGLGDGFAEMAQGADRLISGIESIMAETDDQPDDFLPKNLFELTGTFSIPGLLPETPVIDLIAGLGIPPDFLESLDMPEDLLTALRLIRDALNLLSGVMPGG